MAVSTSAATISTSGVSQIGMFYPSGATTPALDTDDKANHQRSDDSLLVRADTRPSS
jgi:hypothetical protein